MRNTARVILPTLTLALAGCSGTEPEESRWQPHPGLAWQWQLDTRVDPSVDVPVYDIDGFENTVADVARLHRDGRKVICYINVGAWENFRPDKADFPARCSASRTAGRANAGWTSAS